MDFESGKMQSDFVRRNWRDVMDYVAEGNHVVVSRAGKPVMALIPMEDFKELAEQLETFSDERSLRQTIANYLKERATNPDPAMERFLAREGLIPAATEEVEATA